LAEPGWRDGLSLLRERDFARLFSARLVSEFGSAMTLTALPFVVLDELGGSASDVGLVLAAGAAAQIAMQLFAGAFADRGSRKTQMVGADLLAATAQGTIAALALSDLGTVRQAIALNACVGLAFALHFPAAVGLVPLVVVRERLQSANAILAMARASAVSIGAAAGGLISWLASPGSALAIDAATFLAAAALVAGIRPTPQPRGESASLLRDLIDGFREFTAHTWLWTIVLQFTLMLMGWFGAWAVVGPVVAKTSLGGVAAWGPILAAQGVGLIAGGAIALRVTFARPMLVATLCCLPGALIPLFLIGPAPVVAIAGAAFISGIGFEIFGVQWNTALHTRIAPEALSRVSSYDVLGSIAMVPVGEALAGWGVDSLGVPTTLVWCFAAIVVPTLAVLCVRDVRQLRAA
jgi:MFS family permease